MARPGGKARPWGLRCRLLALTLAPVAIGVALLILALQLAPPSRERDVVLLMGVLVVVPAAAVVGRRLTGQILEPLQTMVAVIGEMGAGNYRERVPSSSIRELDVLGGAVNHLAEELDVQVTGLARQAFHDPLSNLPNRALFMERLKHALTRAESLDRSVAVLFLDLDNFKVVNDSLGHQNGDHLLIAVAERIMGCLRNEDSAGRLSGDEFTVLIENVADVAEAERVAQRIQAALQTPVTIEGREVFTGASIGIAVSTPGYDGPDSLLRDADLAMYRAKAHGRGRYEVFDRGLNAVAMERLELETDLRRAVERNELLVYYQPIMQLETGKITEVEALLRWQHPRRGLLLPAEFLALAEQTGLIVPIGRWVLQEACCTLRGWQSRYPTDPPLSMSINLSHRDFQQPDLVDEIARVLQENRLDPGCLELEITESAVMADADTTVATLRKLKALGVRLAIDDFGTGNSSLSCLKRFPVDTLKVDRTFIDGLGHHTEDGAIAHAVVAFAKALGLSVTAEGIETVEQLAEIQALACERGQGYYLARPLPADAVSALFAASVGWLGRNGWDLRNGASHPIGAGHDGDSRRSGPFSLKISS